MPAQLGDTSVKIFRVLALSHSKHQPLEKPSLTTLLRQPLTPNSKHLSTSCFIFLCGTLTRCKYLDLLVYSCLPPPDCQLQEGREFGSILPLLNPHSLVQRLAQQILIKRTRKYCRPLKEGKAQTLDSKNCSASNPLPPQAKMSAEGLISSPILLRQGWALRSA